MQALKFNSPATVIEGQSYLVRVAVVNQSFRAGVPVGATLEVLIMASVDGVDLIPYDTRTAVFGAGETKTFESALNIPSGYGGMTGIIVANVFDPNGNLLDSGSEELVIGSAVISASFLPMLIWYESMTYWEYITPGREIPLNEEIHLAPHWLNTSDVNVVGHVDLTIIYPDGTERILSAVMNQDMEAVPGDGWNVQFEPFTSSQAGTYTAVATVSGSGILDTMETELVAVGEDYFVSCEVPAQIARGAIPPPGQTDGTEMFWASQRVWLTARAGKLYSFELLVDKTGVPINPAEYPGAVGADVLRLWNNITYLTPPAQLTQLFPVERDDFYEGIGYAPWYTDPVPVSLGISALWHVPPPRGVYKIISRCSIISCDGYRTWGQWELLWEIDTGKTIEIV